NHKSTRERPDIIKKYCNDKVELGCMSGPFSKEEVHHIFGGHFISSPLGLVEKSGELGKYWFVWDLFFKNKDRYTINSWLDADDFPTEWGTAAQVAENRESFVESLQ
ncbi:uncharacterized protein EDB93DRAFT_1096635, partial [Suillus bovinus]|uniref:uncharacterized protein n=1 Tax=Suillus bovinus TaxID=48563 RepID=UPI001B881757